MARSLPTLTRSWPWLCVAALLLASPLTAQTPEPPEGEDSARVPATPPLPHWQLSLGLLGGYESNVDFRTPAVGDYGGFFRASIGRNWRGPRGRFSLGLSGTGVAYAEQTAASRADGGANVAWTQRLSPRVEFNLAGYGAYDTTTSQSFVADIGQVLPRARSWNVGGNGGFDFKLGPHTSLRLAGRYSRVSFEGPLLVGTQSAQGDAALARKLGRRDEVSLSYGFLRTRDEARGALDSHFAALGWGRTLSRHLSLSLTGGVGYNPKVTGGIEQAWYFHGSAGLQGHWRKATLAALASQSVTPAYGLGGSQISDTVTLAATVPFGRRVELSMSGAHTWGRFRSGTRSDYTTDNANLSLGLRLFRHTGLEAGYGYRRSDAERAVALDGHRAFFGFTYSRP